LLSTAKVQALVEWGCSCKCFSNVERVNLFDHLVDFPPIRCHWVCLVNSVNFR
jgi:hypothetical protein